jgi:hypothetical protein
MFDIYSEGMEAGRTDATAFEQNTVWQAESTILEAKEPSLPSTCTLFEGEGIR